MFQVGDVLGKGWNGFKNNVGVCIGAFIVAFAITMVVSLILQLVVGGLAAATGSGVVGAVLSLIMQLVNVVVQVFFTMGMISIFLKISRNESAEVGDLFSQGDKLVQGVIAQILVGILVVVGTLLLIVPGIFAAMFTFLALWFVVDQDLDAIPAIKASYGATKGNLGPIFLWGLAGIGLSILGAIPLGLGLLIVAPVLGISAGHIYRALVGEAGATPESA